MSLIDSPENRTQHFGNHVHLSALEILSALAEGAQNTVASIVAHAERKNNIMLKTGTGNTVGPFNGRYTQRQQKSRTSRNYNMYLFVAEFFWCFS